jgi:hypothetical protein
LREPLARLEASLTIPSPTGSSPSPSTRAGKLTRRPKASSREAGLGSWNRKDRR